MSQVGFSTPSRDPMFMVDGSPAGHVSDTGRLHSFSPVPSNPSSSSSNTPSISGTSSSSALVSVAPKCWDEEEVLLMLKWLRPHKNRRRYANGLKANCCRELSEKILPNKRPKQIRNKLEYMIREYQRARQVLKAYRRKHEVRRMANGGGGGGAYGVDGHNGLHQSLPDPLEAARKACAFFDELNHIFGNDPEVVTDDEAEGHTGSGPEDMDHSPIHHHTNPPNSHHHHHNHGLSGMAAAAASAHRRPQSLSPSMSSVRAPRGSASAHGFHSLEPSFATKSTSLPVQTSASAHATNGAGKPASAFHHSNGGSGSSQGFSLPPIQHLDNPRASSVGPPSISHSQQHHHHHQQQPHNHSHSHRPRQQHLSSHSGPHPNYTTKTMLSRHDTAGWNTGTSPATGLPDLTPMAAMAAIATEAYHQHQSKHSLQASYQARISPLVAAKPNPNGNGNGSFSRGQTPVGSIPRESPAPSYRGATPEPSTANGGHATSNPFRSSSLTASPSVPILATTTMPTPPTGTPTPANASSISSSSPSSASVSTGASQEVVAGVVATANDRQTCGLETLASLSTSPQSPTTLLAHHDKQMQLMGSVETMQRQMQVNYQRMFELIQEQQASNRAFQEHLLNQQKDFLAQMGKVVERLHHEPPTKRVKVEIEVESELDKDEAIVAAAAEAEAGADADTNSEMS
ncbi:hypothetical protein H4R33_005558 [Dimargaris cristalligena]|uniref:Uncharacterized protein n=1 Tax=Dimargaris cristalligena TaxID=215637 RepID=A0A4P9ZWG9_9FUNG|nr:hypothetical protein H4R33_005558 [Dimargaris cristalligena]RKP37984.1 hypothetical protein BJ085DRAFT_33587 [Dimargaris cristalligena]|eukprot:RKP37984.1 hypothetical protein BJ085DRAFT_33587 [Dimargaris cristalligena]